MIWWPNSIQKNHRGDGFSGVVQWTQSVFYTSRGNKLLKEARAELNEDKRRALYYECRRLVSDEGGVIVPMYADLLLGVGEKLGHGKS